MDLVSNSRVRQQRYWQTKPNIICDKINWKKDETFYDKYVKYFKNNIIAYK